MSSFKFTYLSTHTWLMMANLLQWLFVPLFNVTFCEYSMERALILSKMLFKINFTRTKCAKGPGAELWLNKQKIMSLVFSQSYCIYKDLYLHCQIFSVMHVFYVVNWEPVSVNPYRMITGLFTIKSIIFIWGAQAESYGHIYTDFFFIACDEGNLQ